MIWRPIETRPDEGEFLAWDPVAQKQDVCIACTEAIYGHLDMTKSGRPFSSRRREIGKRNSCYSTQSDGEYGPSDDEFQGDRATHWAPLPEPPVSSPLERLDRLAEELDSLYND